MVNILTNISRFLLILLFAIYTYSAFAALKRKSDYADKFYSLQGSIMLLILYISHFIIFINLKDIRVLVICVAESVFIFAVMLIYKKIYKSASVSLVNNMCMLLCIGFIILTRLDISFAFKQLIIASASLLATAFIPFIIRHFKYLDKLTYLYAFIGIFGLLCVNLFGKSEYGANLSINIGGFSLQPTELIKVIFVFFAAAGLYKAKEFKQIVTITIIAAIHVLILVMNKDLGGGLVFLITYLVMLYVSTHKLSFFLLGIALSSLASVMAYFIFNHVRVRVLAWKDPLSVIDGAGYQVSQSLFAIGTGGWFGSGLTKGLPNTIPVVKQDFIFAAISEELGGVFALCLIFVCISCVIMFMNVSIQIKNPFYKLTALGLGTVYGAQVFVSIGGVIKFIPATGITLPLVSYGGSSILGTMLIFAITQGLYGYRNDELEAIRENY